MKKCAVPMQFQYRSNSTQTAGTSLHSYNIVTINACLLVVGTKANGHLGKGVTQVPYAHFPQMLTNGHWGKWTFRGKEYPKCPVPISPNFSKGEWRKWELGANGHLGNLSTCPSSHFALENRQWALGVPVSLKCLLPQVPIFPTAY